MILGPGDRNLGPVDHVETRKHVGPGRKARDQDQHARPDWLSDLRPLRSTVCGRLLRFRLLDDSAAVGVDPDGSAVVLVVGQLHFVHSMIAFFFQMAFFRP
jgi:hypothetical protein